MRLKFLEHYEPKERIAIWVSLAIHICCAWFSIGYHYDDEHWQILEFANYKLGLSPATDLPWEFAAQIRPTLQPFMVIFLAKAMMAIKMYNPFTLAFILRLITAIISWFASLLIIKIASGFLKDKTQQYFFILFSSFLWFMPYIHIRFSGETWSGLFFFFGLYHLLAITELNYSKNWVVKSVLVGACFGISFWCRFQIVFAFLGIGFWLLFYRGKTLARIIPAIGSGLLLLGIGILLDHAFYNAWVFTPYKYFESNILNNVAARYGETPWWDYFYMFILHGGIPLSIVLLAAVFLSVLSNPKNPYIWVLIVFVTGHMMVGHKELRFLFPMVYIFPVCCFLFLSNVKIMDRLAAIPERALKISKTVLIAMNVILLIVMSFLKPPSEHVFLYQYVYEKTKGKPTKIITLEKNPYRPATLLLNFYQPPNLQVVTAKSISELDSLVENSTETVYFFDNHFDLSPDIVRQTHTKFEILYRNLPEFIQDLNFNGWVDRQKVYCLYSPVEIR